MLNEEVWKKVEEFPDYEVSSEGNVRSMLTLVGGKPLRLSYFVNSSGYRCVSFSRGDGRNAKRLVHRVVAEAFCERLEGKDVVNHLNGEKIDNRAKNLEWVTQRENLEHARAAGRMVYNKPTQGLKLPSRSGTSKRSEYLGVCWSQYNCKWVGQLVYDKVRYGSRRFDTELEAAEYRDELVIRNNLPLPLNFSKSLTTIPEGSTPKPVEMVAL